MTWGGRGLGSPLGVRRGLPRPNDLSAIDWWHPGLLHAFEETGDIDPDISTWSQAKVATPVGGQADPDGGTDAYLITDTNDTGPEVHSIYESAPAAVSGWIRDEIWLKPGTLTSVRIKFGRITGGTDIECDVDLSAGTFSVESGGIVATLIDSAAGGWKRYRFEGIVDTDEQVAQILIVAVVGGTSSYQGDGTGTFYVYSPAGSFKQSKIQIISSKGVDPDISTWSQAKVATPVGGQADPDGGADAYLITDTNDTGPEVHSIYEGSTGAVSGWMRDEIWLKPGTLTSVRIKFGRITGGTDIECDVDLSAGTFSLEAGNIVATLIDSAAGGWKRYRFEGIVDTDEQVAQILIVAVVGGTASYQGDGTGTFYVYHPPGSFQQNRVSSTTGEGSGAHAATETSDEGRPILVPDDWNGLPSFRFLDDGWDANAAAAALGRQYTIAVLLEWVTDGVVQCVWDIGQGSYGMYIVRNPAGALLLRSSNSGGAEQDLTGVVSGQNVIVVSADLDVGTGALWVDGVRTDVAVRDFSIDIMRIGGLRGGTERHLQARMREFALFDRALTDQEERMLRAGMRARGRLLP